MFAVSETLPASEDGTREDCRQFLVNSPAPKGHLGNHSQYRARYLSDTEKSEKESIYFWFSFIGQLLWFTVGQEPNTMQVLAHPPMAQGMGKKTGRVKIRKLGS